MLVSAPSSSDAMGRLMPDATSVVGDELIDRDLELALVVAVVEAGEADRAGVVLVDVDRGHPLDQHDAVLDRRQRGGHREKVEMFSPDTVGVHAAG